MKRTHPATIRLPSRLWKVLGPVSAEACDLGIPLYLAGGCVRDLILRRPASHDLDLVAESDPAPLARLCARMLGADGPAASQFGTLRVIGGSFRVDFAISRSETYAAPAALPEVRPAPIVSDLARRDFTVNAMALKLEREGVGALIDPHGGRRDLEARTLRVLHPASFRDDPTRVFRMARYLWRLGLRPAAGLTRLATEALERGWAARLSRHRLMTELLRVLDEADPAPALRRLRRLGYLELVHPGLRPARSWPEGRLERLGVMAVGLGEAGREFVRSLPLERPMSAPVVEALKLAETKSSPAGRPSRVAAGIIRHADPRLAPAALRARFLTGRDLQGLGVEPGAGYGAILDEAGRLQWAGRLRSRKEALRWLSARLRS
ncbi:MAG: hypothetical protein HY927_10395 [Elusimicrobia bacterium]|nr:hypothetical protein [Elusimicrobiota bacterium]